MPKTYAYNLRLEQEDAFILDGWHEAGLSRSAILRLAIDDIPVQVVIRRLANMRMPYPEEESTKVGFSIYWEQRAKLDALKVAGVEAAFVVRHSLKRYIDKSIEELKLIPGSMRSASKQKSMIEKQKLAARILNGKELDPLGARERHARIRAEAKARSRKSKSPASVPVKNPGIDWSEVGPVQPRRHASKKASDQVETIMEALPAAPAPKKARAPRTAHVETLDALKGITFEEAEERKRAPESSPLDALRAMRNKK